MKTKIENEKEFKSVIDQLGEALEDIENRKADADVLKRMLDVYATENRVKAATTDHYRFKMVKGSKALKRGPGISEASVVAHLKADETLCSFVSEVYDTKGITAHVSKQANGDDILASLGLYLTDPKPHAEVTPLAK